MSILNQPFKAPPSCFSFKIGRESPTDDFLFQPPKPELTSAVQEKKVEIDALLSEALNGLTFHERQEQQEVLHGVCDEIIEETDFVESALKELGNHLLRIKQASSYEKAERMNPDYVNSRAFRRMFLRSNRYDTKAAADQMIRFFEAKEELFGTEKLTKDITITDLDQEDLKSLKCGSFHWAGYDRSSRRIMFQLPGLRAYKTLANELRARYYFTMEALKSDEVQLRGVSVISYGVDAFADQKNGEGFMENTRLAVSLPLCMASVHACGSDVSQHLIGNLAVRVMPADLRARFRMHLGSHLETQYILSTYGISPDQLPLKPWTNECEMEGHLKWVQDRFDEARVSPSILEQAKSLAIQPTPDDVLYIGGKKTNNRGNVRLRTLVRELAPVYASVPTEKKRLVVDRMIQKIQETGGRFLQQNNDGWFELPIGKVRPKVSQSFRNFKSKREASAQPKVPTGELISGEPLPQDVIFGRSQKSRGNELLSRLIKERSEEYDALDRGQKQGVVNAVIVDIKSQGGRFLQPTADYGGWLELTNDIVRDKVSRYFRNYRRPSTKKSAKIVSLV